MRHLFTACLRCSAVSSLPGRVYTRHWRTQDFILGYKFKSDYTFNRLRSCRTSLAVLSHEVLRCVTILRV